MSTVDIVITWSIAVAFYALGAWITGGLFHDNKDRLANETVDARLAAAVLVGVIWPLAWLYAIGAWVPRAATTVGPAVAHFSFGLGDLVGPRLTALTRWRQTRRKQRRAECAEATRRAAFPTARIHKQ